MKRTITVLCLTLVLAGCSNLLPRGRTTTVTPWGSFEQARQVFDGIKPNQTTVEDLKKLSLDPYTGDNIAILNYTDLARRLVADSDLGANFLDPALKDCLAAREQCYAYEIDQKHQYRRREGNFFLDFLNFKRTTDVTGWRFNAIIVIKQKLVVYKLWSGQPAVHEIERERNPLGPAQGLGGSALRMR